LFREKDIWIACDTEEDILVLIMPDEVLNVFYFKWYFTKWVFDGFVNWCWYSSNELHLLI